jgi:ribosomal protein S18 acetylase RimI-like enzyme
MEFHGRNALIDELFLTAPYRDQGIGAKTLQFVFEESRYWGVHTLRLEVDRSNERAKALYQKMGFSFQPHDRRHLMARRIEQ